MIRQFEWSNQDSLFLNVPQGDTPELKRYYLVRRLETLNEFADAKNAGSKFHVVQLENGNNTVG